MPEPHTVSLADLDQGSEMIIFESIWTTFEVISIFDANEAVGKIGSSLKLNHYKQMPKLVKHTVDSKYIKTGISS
jgi:hypothetical protein